MLAFGPRAKRQREAIADAIAPIWEANHVWLILVIVLLFTGFPRGFATMMTALNIPMTVMLLGIVLRGSAFVFRKYDGAPSRCNTAGACFSAPRVSSRRSSREPLSAPWPRDKSG